MTTVPNLFPSAAYPYPIAVIGEAPGRDEEIEGVPFVGQSGRFLSALLSRAGIQREACFIGNVCQHHPPNNEIGSFDWTGPEIQSGLAQLQKDLTDFSPNIVICLGGAAIHALRCPDVIPKKGKQKGRFVFRWPYSPSLWRGSFFESHSFFSSIKCLGTVHPAYVLAHDYESAPLLQLDLKKAVADASTKKLNLPQRMFDVCLTPTQIKDQLLEIQHHKTPISIDIEGGVGTMSCISFARSPNYAFIIPFFDKHLNRCFSLDEEVSIWRHMAQVLEDPTIPKILQNSLYDRFVLAYSYGITVQGVHDDTMLKHWELYCELEKALDVQTSIYTNEPYYKGNRKSQDDSTFFRYCCMDSAVTYEINSVIDPRITGSRRDHYRLNMDLLDVFLDMELRGFRYNTSGAVERRANIRHELFEEQAKVNGLCGGGIMGHNVFDLARTSFAKKKAFLERGDYGGIVANALKDSRDDARRLSFLVHEPAPTLATLGELESLLGVGVNTGSNQQMCSLLYETLGLPIQHKRRGPGQTDEPPPTADYEALLKLCKYCNKKEDETKLQILQHLIRIRSLATRERMLGIHADSDGRIRCAYNEVGSNTGRITCYESPTGSGYNLQTIPEYDRDLFLADPGYWMFQCDLKGADGWTVACYAAMLGDPTMLDDYKAGLKPAQILVLRLEGHKVDFTNRQELRLACKTVKKESWSYFAMKRVQHGCSYLEGPVTVSENILKDSEGALYLPPKECERLRAVFFDRYPGIPRWHKWLANRMEERPTLIAASGSVRHFFGRKEELLTKACAHEAQHNTTYATKLAVYRCWKDPDNQNRIIPLHTVHDSFIGQFKQDDTSWAVPRIREYFNNPLTIAGQRIVIPFDGTYGPSWGEQNVGTI